MSNPTNLKNLFAAVASSSNGGATTIFTHGAALKNPDNSAGYGGVLDRLVIYNGDTIAHIISIYRVPSSNAASDANLIERQTLQSKAPLILEGPYYSTDSDFYQGGMAEAASSSNSLVRYQAYYHEMS